MRALELTNHRFGRLVAERFSHSNKQGRHWICRCDCGGMSMVTAKALRFGELNSCGCQQFSGFKPTHDAQLKHGFAKRGHKPPEYTNWQQMLRRCHTPTHKNFADYGGRGISVCKRWRHSFPNFLADMGKRPTALHSIDRMNNDGNYEPRNCRWATMKEQCSNRRPRSR